jgi:hypothetical protein
MREVEFYFLCGPLFAAIQYALGTRPIGRKKPAHWARASPTGRLVAIDPATKGGKTQAEQGGGVPARVRCLRQPNGSRQIRSQEGVHLTDQVRFSGANGRYASRGCAL